MKHIIQILVRSYTQRHAHTSRLLAVLNIISSLSIVISIKSELIRLQNLKRFQKKFVNKFYIISRARNNHIRGNPACEMYIFSRKLANYNTNRISGMKSVRRSLRIAIRHKYATYYH